MARRSRAKRAPSAAPPDDISTPAPPKEEPPPPPPPPPDVPVALVFSLFVVMGAVIGLLTGLGHWGLTFFAAVGGLIGGITCGATVAKSLFLPPRIQLPLLAALIVLGFVLYGALYPQGLAPLAPSMAGGVCLVLSWLAGRFDEKP